MASLGLRMVWDKFYGIKLLMTCECKTVFYDNGIPAWIIMNKGQRWYMNTNYVSWIGW